jgi:uncharacterized membrane protein HdeD (DUF308 family)
MEAKTFQDMVKQGTLAGSDTLNATGIAMIVIGILAILAPLASGVLFDLLFGALFIGAGVVELIEAFRSGTWQRGLLIALAGLITLAAGAVFIARPTVGLVALAIVFLAYLILLGAFRIVLAFELPSGTPGRVWSFVSGAVALVLAYLSIVQMPNISQWLIGTFVGVSLIFSGVARISLGRGIRHAGEAVATPLTPRGAHT